MNDDTFMILLGYKGKQSFCIHGSGIRFPKVENIQSLLKKGCYDFVFFNKISGWSYQNKFHKFCYSMVSPVE